MDIGYKYKVYTINSLGKKSKQHAINYEGVLVAEYDNFYLFDCGRYRTTLHKGMLKCRDYAVEAVS
ncbi:MAG: hypothetical protein GX957_00690 [Clostridiaceae bacterium]|nr:hypothetical protein [Clostridiaceae bacterium]